MIKKIKNSLLQIRILNIFQTKISKDKMKVFIVHKECSKKFKLLKYIQIKYPMDKARLKYNYLPFLNYLQKKIFKINKRIKI